MSVALVFLGAIVLMFIGFCIWYKVSCVQCRKTRARLQEKYPKLFETKNWKLSSYNDGLEFTPTGQGFGRFILSCGEDGFLLPCEFKDVITKDEKESLWRYMSFVYDYRIAQRDAEERKLMPGKLDNAKKLYG